MDSFGVERAMATTIHAYTASQALVTSRIRNGIEVGLRQYL